jgi:glycosyltransferase involved in cell wall biosynthesis
MRLLVLDQFSEMGGAQQCLLDLLPAIRARGWEALVGLPGQGELVKRVQALGCETAAITCGPYTSGRKSLADMARFAAGTPRLAREVRRLAERLDPDLIYVNGPRLLPALGLADLGRPLLFHAHSYLAAGAIRGLAGQALRATRARLVGQSEFVAEPWREFAGAERVSVVYNGVAGPACAPEPAPGRAPRVGCIGRVAPEKGQREFVAVAARLHRALPECRFTICGAALFAGSRADGYEHQVRAEAAGLPVEFAGWVDDVYQRMAGLDLILVPSAAIEATTRVILEAFAAGRPVIAFPSGGIPEVVEHGVNGMLARSVEEMAEQAVELLSDGGERRRAMTAAARETWKRRFTLERYREAMLEIMEGCTTKTPTGASPGGGEHRRRG